MEKYDDHLAFDLPEGFLAVTGENDDGEPWYNIKFGKGTNENGEDTYEHSASVCADEPENAPSSATDPSGFSLNGDLDSFVVIATKELKVLIFTMNVYTALFWIRKDEHVYRFTSTRVIRDDDELGKWLEFLNGVLSSIEIDGTKGNFEALTVERITSEKKDLDQPNAADDAFPCAKPLPDQHTHLDFLNKTKGAMSFLGGLVNVNQSGTEYSFQAIGSLADETDSPVLKSAYRTIRDADAHDFDLVETAHDMAELFRVNADAFDEGHDREQEILEGYIQRCEVYNKFRSFAWTFAAYCDKENKDPAAVDFPTIHEIVDHIEKRDGLNYKADSFSPVICSGDDLHVYYIPDSVPENTRTKLLDTVNEGAENAVQTCGIRSLDGLRKELSYLYPAIRAIYDELEAKRDRSVPLTDSVADILYAWCSMAYAARESIFSEDGPMNCWWEHPDMQAGGKIPFEKHLKPVERPEVKEEVKAEKETLTYSDGLVAKGSGFTMAIPDGFTILENAEGRDFIAYLPNEEEPEYYLSSFIIYAGKKQEGEIFSQLKTEAEFMSIGLGIGGQTQKMFADSEIKQYTRKDLPGVIIFGFDPGCLHANAFLGVDDHLQAMRVQVEGVTRRNKEEYERKVIGLFDRMTAEKPVRMLDEPDAEKYIRMSDQDNAVSEWINCIEEYVAHIGVARNLEQNFIVDSFKGSGGNLAQLKKDIRKMLARISAYTEEKLVKAEAVYTLKRAEYPESPALRRMKTALKSLADTAYQEVNIDKDHMEVVSETAANVKKRLSMPIFDAVDDLVEHASGISTELINAVVKAKTENEAVIREIEEKRLAEEKRKAEEKRLAEERRKAEQARIAEERRKAEEERKRQEEEEKRRKEEEERRIVAENMQKRPERIQYLEYARGLIGGSSMHGFAYVKPDGTVVSHSNYYVIGKGAPGDTSRFSNVKSVVCSEDGIVGLRYDGTCVATKPGFTYAYINECNYWFDIASITAGEHQVIGLRHDGTCVANTIKWNTGYGYDGQSDVQGWKNIVAVACGECFTLGLQADGTVLLACTSEYCKVRSVKNWTDVEMIAAGSESAVGLTKDGKLLTAGGVSTEGIDPRKGIVQLAVCNGQAYALYVDGTVGGGGGKSGWNSRHPEIKEKNVISITSSSRALYVLTEDGKIIPYDKRLGPDIPGSIRIFESYDQIMTARIQEAERKRKEAEEAERQRLEEEKIHAERRAQGVCQYCGGTFKKAFLSMKCESCGRKKDY